MSPAKPLERDAASYRVVVTGGPGSGKTTLVEALAARVYATVPEAGIQVIEALNREPGLEAVWLHPTYVAGHRVVGARPVGHLEFAGPNLESALAGDAEATGADILDQDEAGPRAIMQPRRTELRDATPGAG